MVEDLLRMRLKFALLVLCCACGETRVRTHPVDVAGPVTPTIAITNAPLFRDTIEAQWVITVALQGESGTGRWVRLSAPSELGREHEHLAYFCPDGFAACHGDARIREMDLRFSGDGMASVGLVFGRRVSSGWIKAVMQGYESVRDSVEVEVAPGSPAQIVATPADTTLYVDRFFTLRATIADRLGNSIAPAVDALVSSLDSSVTVTGSNVVGSSFGRGRVQVSTGAFVDTVSITVPPAGTLAAYQSGPGAIVQIELDGSGHRTLAQASAPYYGIWPVWGPDDRVVYESGGYDQERLFITDTSGVSTRVTDAATVTRGEVFAAAGPGGIYFAANGGSQDYGNAIWRVSSAGGVPSRIGPNPPNLANNWQASLSPDGQRLVYRNVEEGLSVLDVLTGQTTSIRGNGQVPQWSPVEDLIVFVDATEWLYLNQPQRLRLIRPDGTSERAVADGHRFIGRAAWSPDGEWLVTRDEGGLRLVRVADGLILPIPWGGGLMAPAWR